MNITKTISLFALAASIGLLSSCGGSTETSKSTENNTVVEKSSAEYDGKAIYEAKCQVCHQANGEGVPGAFPPLAKSDYLTDKIASIKATRNGLQGEIVVNGVTYNSVMAPVPMSDEELLAVMNYVYSSWGNEGSVSMDDILNAK